MILAIGADLASVSRFEGVLECTQNGELAHPLARRCFTEEELRYAQAKANPAQHLAAAYAAKEALAKAVLSASGRGVLDFRRFSLSRTDAGAPFFQENDALRSIKEELGAVRVHVSVSHQGKQALAFVVLES